MRDDDDGRSFAARFEPMSALAALGSYLSLGAKAASALAPRGDLVSRWLV